MLSYERTGRGPGVVLLHSLGGDRTVWRDEAPRLAQTHTVLSLDLPGHGQSPSAGTVDFREIARAVTQLIRREALAPAVVVGHSIGGTLGAWTPVADPQAVRAVLIVDSSLCALPWPPGMLAELRRSFAEDYESGLRAFYARIANGPAQTERLVSLARKVSPETFLGYLEYASGNSIVGELERLSTPVELITSGIYFDTDDHPAELRAAGYAGLQRFTAHELGRTRHWVYWDQPDAYAALVDAFLERVQADT